MIRVNQQLVNFASELYGAGAENLIVEKTVRPKEILIEQGAKSRFVYIVKSGIAKCYLSSEDGYDFIQEFFGAGEVFGEIELFTGEESFCSVEAVTDFAAYKFSTKNFLKLLEENREFNSLMLRALAEKIRYKADRHSFNQSNPIETKLLRLINQFPDLFATIPKQDVAGYLGITERSLNRSLKILKDNKLFI